MSSTSETPFVIAFTSGKVFAGLLNGTMAQVGATGLNGDSPVSMQLTDPIDGKSKVYAVDATDSLVIEPVSGTIANWGTIVNASGVGTFPARCALTCAWRGRAVLARQPNNAAIWYMSRVFDPYDFDYGADPSETAAVAGTNAKIGQPGDSITALIPVNDDNLLFGCRSKMYLMMGDPGAGGTLVTVSEETGVLGPKTWCFDEHAVLYFMAPGGLYKWTVGSRPTLVSGRRLYYLLDRINSESVHVEMAYDSFRRYVHITITPTDGTVGTHVIYDVVGNSFWPVQYPSNYGPWSLCGIHGNADIDRQVILGCDDGYIRRPNGSLAGDDGKTIETRLNFAPIMLDRGQYEAMVKELQATGVTGDGPLSWYLHTGDSAAQVTEQVDGTEQASGTWFADGTGFQEPVALRVSGGAHQLRLRQTSKTARWSFEDIRALIAETSRRRG